MGLRLLNCLVTQKRFYLVNTNPLQTATLQMGAPLPYTAFVRQKSAAARE